MYNVVTGGTEMDPEIVRELGLPDPGSLTAFEYAQRCIAIYEETLKAMGIPRFETVDQSVGNSQLNYQNPPEITRQYANVSECY